MANTTNLNLVKLSGSEKLKTYPTSQAGNMDIIDTALGAGFGANSKPSVNTSINNLADGLAIIANGNTHAAITSGQFVYVRNHGSLSEGLYTATANISANGTLSGSNLTADTNGGLNSVYSALNSKITSDWGTKSTWLSSIETGASLICSQFGNQRNISFFGVSRTHNEDEVLFTVPEGNRPPNDVFATGYCAGVAIVIRIQATTGNCTLYLKNNAGSGRVIFTISYSVFS